MAVTIGTNAGFVTVAPTADPAGNNGSMDNGARVTKDTSPATAAKVTEIGWWCDNATEAANFEVGIYAADGAVVPGEAGTLLHVSRTNAKGTTSGWKRVTGLDWAISPNTVYWIGVQLDNTATLTNNNNALTGGQGHDNLSGATTLPDPFGGGAFPADVTGAYYAVWEESSGPTYTLTADAGSLALTGQAMSPIVSRLIAMATGTYTLTGQATALLKQYVLTAITGVYTLTGNVLDFFLPGWHYVSKIVASFGNESKHTSSYGQETKHTANYGSEAKNTATYASPTKNTGTDNYQAKS